MSLVMVLVLFLVLAVLFGGYGASRPGWGYYGWGPLGLILLLILILFLTGNLHV